MLTDDDILCITCVSTEDCDDCEERVPAGSNLIDKLTTEQWLDTSINDADFCAGAPLDAVERT